MLMDSHHKFNFVTTDINQNKKLAKECGGLMVKFSFPYQDYTNMLIYINNKSILFYRCILREGNSKSL